MSYPVVITHVIGGLGNQMFQAAAGMALAKKLGGKVLFDIHSFKTYSLRKNGFELDRVFQANFRTASERDVRNVLGWRSGKVIQKILSRKVGSALRGKCFFVEDGMFDRAYFSLSSSCYIKGYFQSENYFKSCHHEIRYAFTFFGKLHGINHDLSEYLHERNTVSIHIRRGDYISDPQTNAVHGACDADYFNKAIEYINERVSNPEFFIFSDDIPWAKSNLSITNKHCFVDWNNGAASYIDMWLMSRCRHHIISNSTFSWWGAWLSNSPDKIVIAPSRWFKSPTLSAEHIIPKEWIQL